jgi:hypothetical protein
MHIFIPPFGSGETFHATPSKITIDEIVANGAVLEFALRTPDKRTSNRSPSRFIRPCGATWDGRGSQLPGESALAAYVVVASAVTLVVRQNTRQSYVGITVLILAAIFMPWLAKEKQRLSAVTGSAALKADAAESALRQPGPLPFRETSDGSPISQRLALSGVA